MGITNSFSILRKSPQAQANPGGSQLIIGFLLMLAFWILDAAMDANSGLSRTFQQSFFAPDSHEFAERSLVLLLTGCFMLYSIVLIRMRATLGQALQEALVSAETERSKVVAIVEAIGDAISIQDPEMKVLYQNRAHQALLGSHLGERCYQAYRGKSQVCGDCHLLPAFRDGAVHRGEMTLQCSQGVRCLEIIATALKDSDDRVIAGIQVVRDITDRKNAEQAAKKEAALLQHLIDTIPNPIYHQDLAGRFLWCNSAFAGWLAKPRQEVIGLSISDLAPLQICRIFQENEPGPGQGAVHECSLEWGDGELRDVIFYKSMFGDCAGERAGVVGVMIDITQRKRAEQEVVELNAALMQQARELNQANRDLKAFSHAISHDLRTPLTRIYSSGQALEEYDQLLDANGRFFVQSINDGCIQLEALLEALMVLSRVTEATLYTEQVDLSKIARAKATELQQLEPGRRVTFLIPPQLKAQGDPKLLYIALDNLIGNAWKYSSGVAEAVIELGCFNSAEGETIFFLKDNGVGFDSSCSDQLFKPFQRLHSPQQFPGTGLGLATVRRIMARHNGRVWGEGKPGCGATFYFTVNG